MRKASDPIDAAGRNLRNSRELPLVRARNGEKFAQHIGTWRAAEQPDLWLNINAYAQQRTDVSSMPTVDYAYYYSYRARGYYVVPYWRDRTDVYRYTEGTLNVDLVDAARNRLVWEGIAVGRVSRGSIRISFAPRSIAFFMNVAATGWFTVGFAPMMMNTSECCTSANGFETAPEPIISSSAATDDA